MEESTDFLIDAQSHIHLESSLLFANPIPAEHSIPKDEMDGIIVQALGDAEVSGASGKENTPFVLKRIREITAGGSVTANRTLIESNVVRGTKIAVHLSRMHLFGGKTE